MLIRLSNSCRLDINNRLIEFIFSYLFWLLYKYHLFCEVFLVEISIHSPNITWLWPPDFDELAKLTQDYDFYQSFWLFVTLNLSLLDCWIFLFFIRLMFFSIFIKYDLSIRTNCFYFHYIDCIIYLLRKYSKFF